MARALGAQPVEFGPGLRARLNPLDAGPLGDRLPADPAHLAERQAEIQRRRLVLLSSLAAMRLGRALTPTEETAVSLAISEASGRDWGRSGGDGAGHSSNSARVAARSLSAARSRTDVAPSASAAAGNTAQPLHGERALERASGRTAAPGGGGGHGRLSHHARGS